jgi:hypothetical protein
MGAYALTTALVFSASSRLMPQADPVEITVLSADVVVLRSSCPIDGIALEDQHHRYHYFVDYRPDRRQAVLVLRTTQDPLRLTVATGLRDTGIRTRHVVVLPNPGNRRAVLRSPE